MSRAPTAYFVFANEQRAEVLKELAAQSENGKPSVAKASKVIGERWKALSDEERQKYKDIAAQKSAELKELREQQLRDNPEAENEGGEDGEAAPAGKTAPPPLPFGLPTSLVKKIANMDPDVARMSADAVRALSLATTLFIEMLAENSLDNAKHMKRKNFKFSDIEDVSRLDRRLMDMGLLELLEHDSVFAELKDKAEEENKNRLANKKANEQQKDANKGMKNIGSFFGQAPPKSASPKVAPGGNEEEEEEAAAEEDEPQVVAEEIAVVAE